MKKFLLSFIFILSAFFSQWIYAKDMKYDLCIAAIFQNEARFMKEWIDYHIEKGVDHFYLYNNNSTDEYADVLSPYQKNGTVTLIQWPSVQQDNDWYHYSFDTQTSAYNDSLTITRGISKWLALIDLDEFIVPIKYDKIIDLLENEFSNCSGLCVNWQCYGTSGIYKAKSLMKDLVYKMKWDHEQNKYSKSIVQPLHVLHCPNPHLCVYLPIHWAIDSRGVRCDSCPDGVYVDKIRINHYWTKDEYHLHNVKIPRYNKWGANSKDTLNRANLMNQEYDPILSNKRD